MGIPFVSSGPVPEDLKTATEMYAAATKTYKNLQSFEKTIHEYTTVCEKLIFQGQCLIAGGKKELTSEDRTQSVAGKTSAMDEIKSAFSNDLTSKVHGPIGKWYGDYKKAGIDLKHFSEKQKELAKSEKKLEKYRAKLAKKEGTAKKEAIEDLKHKIDGREKVTEGLRQEYDTQSPKVTQDLETLLQDAKILKSTLFSAFDTSADHMKTLGSVGASPLPPIVHKTYETAVVDVPEKVADAAQKVVDTA